MERAEAAFTTTEFHVIENGTHGFPPSEHKIATINDALDFLKKNSFFRGHKKSNLTHFPLSALTGFIQQQRVLDQVGRLGPALLQKGKLVNIRGYIRPDEYVKDGVKYLLNGDPTGLTDDDIQMIFSHSLEQLKGDEVIRRRKIYDVIPFSDDEPNGQPYFSSVP